MLLQIQNDSSIVCENFFILIDRYNSSFDILCSFLYKKSQLVNLIFNCIFFPLEMLAITDFLILFLL